MTANVAISEKDFEGTQISQAYCHKRTEQNYSMSNIENNGGVNGWVRNKGVN